MATPTDQPFTLLYVSQLAASAPLDVVAVVAKHARVRNGRDGISGLLVFDGQSFAQLVEGPSSSIAGLWDRLKLDPRHAHMEMLSLEPLMGPRRFASWQLGYWLLEDDEGIERLSGLRGQAALQAFDALVPNLDVGVGEALPA